MPIMDKRIAIKNALRATAIPPLSLGVDPAPIRERHASTVVTLALMNLKFDERTSRTLACNVGGVPRARFDKCLTKLGYK